LSSRSVAEAETSIRLSPNRESPLPESTSFVATNASGTASGAAKRADQWVVGFALETEDRRLRALAKAERKSCDLMVMNGPEAMNAPDNRVEVLDRQGNVVAEFAGPKEDVARGILAVIQDRLVQRPNR
jgi:phosphopantothenoylcysteine synthetase/decarboxylase